MTNFQGQLTQEEYIDKQEHIQFEHMRFTYFYSFYSQYGYKSIGMILRLLHTYCNLSMAEHHSVGDGKIYFYGNENKVFATYIWDDVKQMAILDFKDGFESTESYRNRQKIFLKGLENGWNHL